MERPILGKKLNVTNCIEYLEDTMKRMTACMTSQTEKKNKQIADLMLICKGITHADYFKKVLPTLVSLSTQLSILADSMRTEISEGEDRCDSRSWADITDYDEVRKEIKEDADSSPSIHNRQDNRDVKLSFAESLVDCVPATLEIKNVGTLWAYNAQFVAPRVEFLEQIPPSIYQYDGDDHNPRGLYICIAPQVYVQLPFMRVMNENSERHRMDKCSRENDCTNPYCPNAHPGAPYFRIGYSDRCPKLPTIGNVETLHKDIKEVEISDIRSLMMHTMSDLAAIYYWFQERTETSDDRVLFDLDICRGSEDS